MIIHILKLIRSRMGGSGWILAELLVVFVVIWFMTSYFLMMGKSWYEPVGYDLEGVYHAVLAVRPSNSPSFVTYEEGGDEAARDVVRIVERLRGHADVEAVALSVSSLPYTLSWSGFRQRKRTADDRLAGLLPCVWHPSRLGRKPGEAGRGSVRDKGRQGSGDIGGVGEAAIWHDRRYRGRYLPAW
mgnify:CR=1 FL=1